MTGFAPRFKPPVLPICVPRVKPPVLAGGVPKGKPPMLPGAAADVVPVEPNEKPVERRQKYQAMKQVCLVIHRSMISFFAGTQSQGSKKVPAGRPGQVDSPSGQVSFHPHLPNGQGIRQVICQLSHQNSKLRLAQGKQNSRVTCHKGKLEFKFFLTLKVFILAQDFV